MGSRKEASALHKEVQTNMDEKTAALSQPEGQTGRTVAAMMTSACPQVNTLTSFPSLQDESGRGSSELRLADSDDETESEDESVKIDTVQKMGIWTKMSVGETEIWTLIPIEEVENDIAASEDRAKAVQLEEGSSTGIMKPEIAHTKVGMVTGLVSQLVCDAVERSSGISMAGSELNAAEDATEEQKIDKKLDFAGNTSVKRKGVRVTIEEVK